MDSTEQSTQITTEVPIDKSCKYDSIPSSIGAHGDEFPHMVLFGYENETINDFDWICDGSLISENVVISSNKCIEPRPILAVLGVLKVTDTEYRQTYGIDRVFESNNNDLIEMEEDYKIVLIKLNSSVTFNDYVRPICLPTIDSEIGKKLTVSGYGKIFYSEYLALFKNELSVVSCPKKIYNETIEFCAISRNWFWFVCTGNAGGSIVTRFKNENDVCVYTMFGITEDVCPSGGIGVIYSKIHPYLEWIECTVWGNCL